MKHQTLIQTSLNMLKVLTALITVFSCSSTRTPLSFPEAQEGYIDAGSDVRLFYRLFGSGPDTLVMIHGGPGFTIDYFIEDLAPLAKDHVLLFYDQRGTGQSTLVSDSILLDAQRFVEDVEAIRNHFGILRFKLLGHSRGSGIITLYHFGNPETLADI